MESQNLSILPDLSNGRLPGLFIARAGLTVLLTRPATKKIIVFLQQKKLPGKADSSCHRFFLCLRWPVPKLAMNNTSRWFEFSTSKFQRLGSLDTKNQSNNQITTKLRQSDTRTCSFATLWLYDRGILLSIILGDGGRSRGAIRKEFQTDRLSFSVFRATGKTRHGHIFAGNIYQLATGLWIWVHIISCWASGWSSLFSLPFPLLVLK